MITTNILGVRIFRKFRVCSVPPSSHSTVHILNRISCKLGQLSRALGWYSSLNHISCKLGQLCRALGWYSSLNHISCKLGQLCRALGWYSSLKHISCKLGQLSRALGWYSSLNHMPWHTVQTQMSSLIRVYTVCHSVCTVWAHYSTEEPHSSNFRVITTNLLGVQIFRKFTVCFVLHLHILMFIYSTISLVNLASYLEPWADIQISTISLVILASYLEPCADIPVSTISLVNLASYLEPWADIQVSTISLEPWADIQVSTISLVNLASYLEPLGWYSSLNHIFCKLGQLSRALGWYSSLNHISCKLGQLSTALGLIFKSQPYLL